jgi:RHS repeat-associated protein
VDAGSGYDTVYTYDAAGRVIKEEFPLLTGQQQRSYVQFVYDCDGKTVTIIDPLGHYLVKEYDSLGRLIRIKTYTGIYGSGTLYATQSYTYRYDDLISTLTDPGGHIYSYTYDFLGRPLQTTYPDASSVSYVYDDTSNRATVTDGRGYERIYWYDWSSRLEKVEEEYAAGTFATTIYTYDELGHLLSFTDPENHTTSYTYASAFGLTQTTYPDLEYELYTYDNMGNVTSFTDCKGNTTSYTYDTLYRPTETTYQDQSVISYAYDLNSNRTRMDDNAPNTGDYVAYTYDNWNRLVTETRHISQQPYTTSYEYDTANRVTKLTYPDSMQILYEYDDLNRTTDIKRYRDGQNDEILFSNPQYDVENLLTQFDYGNGIRTFYTYDSRHRPSTIDVKDGATSLIDLDYTYDNNSNITQLVNGWRDTSSTWHSETESYSYDGLDRLTSATCTSWSHTYTYDKAGNRIGKDSLTYTVNAVNEVTALSDGTTFTYDDNGNRTQKTKGTDTRDYTYDHANRLTKVEENQSTIGEYVYDGGGKRLQKTEDSITTTYIYSGINPVYEENSTGSAGYIYGPSGLIAKRTTIDQETNTYYYHKDHLGSTRSVTDSSKNIISASTYHPFGETVVEEGSEHYLYTGKEKDSTGLYYYGARHYDPQTGKFITRDLIKGRKSNSQTLNLYTYCLNNPIKYIDPTGLDSMCTGDGESRRCFEYTEKGWIAYDGEGNKIASSAEIQEHLDQGNRLETVMLILQALGFTIDSYNDVSTEDAPDGSIKVIINDTEITIKLGGTHETKPNAKGSVDYPWVEGEAFSIHIYDSAFTSVNKLFHVVGHEMQHAKHYAKGGKFWDWFHQYGGGPQGRYLAKELSEMYAWQWNMKYYNVAPFEGGIFEFLSMWNKAYKSFLGYFG